MRFSIAYTFAPGLLEALSRFPEVTEVYGKMDPDLIGGGRSSYTLPSIRRDDIEKGVQEARRFGIDFNYLLNGATLGGIEQTRRGQRKIRALLGFLCEIGVKGVTVASPWLLRMVKTQFPGLKVRVGVFSVIDSPQKAGEWAEYGADTLCISAIACNRDFKKLRLIRKAVGCDLQLIANAGCLPHCAYELTHMNLLTQSSSQGDFLKGFCMDYCFLNCSLKKLKNPLHYIRSTWIRPEDLRHYEALGYDNFKILERSCPADLLVRRVRAYAERRFDGNLLEIVGPVAELKKEQGASPARRFKTLKTLFRPFLMKPSSLALMKRYAEAIIPHRYDRQGAGVYLDNRALDGFLERLMERDCPAIDCNRCGLCAEIAEKAVVTDKHYVDETRALGERLEAGLHRSAHWL